MEFIGTDPGASIPIPNLNLTPEMICKNFPLDFLLQPIIPLLQSHAAAEEPSYFVTFPSWLKETCLGISMGWHRPILQIVGVGIAATSVAYFTWKLSMKWNEGLFDLDLDADVTTEKLDEEVERIMFTIPEENTVSTCFSFTDHRDLDPNLITSFTSSTTGVFSKEKMCPCEEVVKPIVRLQSRVDQVMSRVEDVMSGIKALESFKSMSRIEEGEENTGNTIMGDNEQTEKSDKNHKDERTQCVTSVESCIKANEQRLTKLSQGIKDLEFQLENIKNVPEKDKNTTSDPCLRSFRANNSWEKSPSIIILCNENDKEEDGSTVRKIPISLPSLSPPYFRLDNSPFRNTSTGIISSPYLERAISPSNRKRSPLRNMKRNNRSRNYNVRPFPLTPEKPSHCTNDGLMTNSTNYKCETSVGIELQSPMKEEINTYHYQHFHKECQRSSFDIKRQDTWPTRTKQWKLSCNNPGVSTNIGSKLPEISFQAIEPSTCIAATEASRFKEATTKVASVDSHNNIATKPSSSLLYGGSKKDDLLSRSNGSGSYNPTDISVEPLNLISKKCEYSGISEINSERLSELNVEETIRESTNLKLSFAGPNKDETGRGKGQNHKLGSSEMDAPPCKLCCLESVDVLTISPCHFSMEKIGQHSCNTAQVLPNAAPQNASGMISRALSPFKRTARKKNDFQVKYIPKGKDDVENNTISSPQSIQCDKEDEWIVIVPTVH